MRRVAPEILEDAIPRPNFWKRAVLVLAVLAALPFALDVGRIALANWRAMKGTEHPYVSTPALDFAGDVLRECRRTSWSFVGPLMRDPPWKPMPTIVLALVWAGLAGLFLRGSRRL